VILIYSQFFLSVGIKINKWACVSWYHWKHHPTTSSLSLHLSGK